MFFKPKPRDFRYPISVWNRQPFMRKASPPQREAHFWWLCERFDQTCVTGVPLDMAAKRAQQTNPFGSTKFAAISLSDEEKRQFKGWWEANEADLNELINIGLREGWKTSSSFDNTNDCFIVSGTMRDEDNKNYDVCVTSRSDNLWEAYGLTFWKIYVLFKDQKLPTEARKNNWG